MSQSCRPQRILVESLLLDSNAKANNNANQNNANKHTHKRGAKHKDLDDPCSHTIDTATLATEHSQTLSSPLLHSTSGSPRLVQGTDSKKMGVADRLRNIDGHSSVSSEFRVYTVSGGVLSLVTVLAIVYLVATELQYNFQTVTRERVHVNSTSSTGLDVEFDISLPKVPCSLLNVDANDPTGQPQSFHLDKQHHIWKHRVKMTEDGDIQMVGDRSRLEIGSTLRDEKHLMAELEKKGINATTVSAKANASAEATLPPKETECGSCYGAGDEHECCDTCEDVKRAYKRKGWHLDDPSSIEQCKQESQVNEADDEGCNVHGVIALSSGGGNFHLAPGRSLDSLDHDEQGQLSVFDVLMKTFEQWNVSHSIHTIKFGDEFPGHERQLDGEWRTIVDAYGMYQYYFQVVPTKYVFLNGTTIQTNQFSVTEHLRHVNPGGGRGLPGVFFFYEISPLHVEIVEEYQRGWVHFFTSVCAVVGGVVTLMGVLDQFLHSRNTAGSAQLVR